jgi:hypothetical protein
MDIQSPPFDEVPQPKTDGTYLKLGATLSQVTKFAIGFEKNLARKIRGDRFDLYAAESVPSFSQEEEPRHFSRKLLW